MGVPSRGRRRRPGRGDLGRTRGEIRSGVASTTASRVSVWNLTKLSGSSAVSITTALPCVVRVGSQWSACRAGTASGLAHIGGTSPSADGSEEEAFLLGVAVNLRHGLPLTQEARTGLAVSVAAHAVHASSELGRRQDGNTTPR